MDKAKDEVINKLIKGQEKMEKDITEIRVDIADLKVSQKQFEGLIHKVLDGMVRVERVVVNIENDLRPAAK